MPRVQLNTTVYMNLDGQPTLVQSGSVVDVDGSNEIHPSCGTVLAESPGTLTRISGKLVPKAVRGVRKG